LLTEVIIASSNDPAQAGCADPFVAVDEPRIRRDSRTLYAAALARWPPGPVERLAMILLRAGETG